MTDLTPTISQSRARPSGNPEFPLVSVIIVVRNGTRDIVGVLDSIREQKYPSLEVLVIDGMSSDGTRALVNDYASNMPDLPIRLLDNPGLIQATGWNVGISAAKGVYFLRVDAVHCRLEPDYISSCIRKMLELQRADSTVGAIGGRRETMAIHSGAWSEAIARAQCSRFGVGNAEYRLGTRAGFTDTLGLALYDRNLVAQVGLFDESLGRSEDNDFHARMRRRGLKLYYFPNARATYHPRITLSRISSQMFHNGWWVSATIVRKRSFPFGIRHLAPFAFYFLLLVLLISGVIGVFLAKPALFTIGGLYILLSLIAGIESMRSFQFWRIVFVFWIMHVSYSAGTAMGFFAPRDHIPVGERTAPGANVAGC
jgi:GT2 family glycosyltransferase